MSKFKDDIAEILADKTIKDKEEAINRRIRIYNLNKRDYEDKRGIFFTGILLGFAIGGLVSLLIFAV
jgi:hypothetical protein